MEHSTPVARPGQPRLELYQPRIGIRATERLLRKASRLAGLKVLHVNSTRHGGGVAEILASLMPLMQDVGIDTDWLVIDGSPEFFSNTKDLHNALQGEPVAIASAGMTLHRDIVHANGRRAQLQDHDVVVVHDPQPLPLIELRAQQTWIWCCHIDLSAPFAPAWEYLAPMVERYDTAVFSLPEYAQPLAVPQRFILPAIDPFSLINKDIPARKPHSIWHATTYRGTYRSSCRPVASTNGRIRRASSTLSPWQRKARPPHSSWRVTRPPTIPKVPSCTKQFARRRTSTFSSLLRTIRFSSTHCSGAPRLLSKSRYERVLDSRSPKRCGRGGRSLAVMSAVSAIRSCMANAVISPPMSSRPQR